MKMILVVVMVVLVLVSVGVCCAQPMIYDTTDYYAKYMTEPRLEQGGMQSITTFTGGASWSYTYFYNYRSGTIWNPSTTHTPLVVNPVVSVPSRDFLLFGLWGSVP